MFTSIKGKRLFELVVDEIRAALERGDLKPGDKLPPEAEMSRQFGVSRTAVREALRILELSGLISIRKGVKGGSFVTDLQVDTRLRDYVSDRLRLGNLTIDQLTEARSSLETIVLEIVGRKAVAADYARLRESIDRSERLFRDGRRDEKLSENWDFHRMLVQITQNPILVDTLAAVNEILRYLMVKIDTSDDMTHRAFAAHRAIVDQLEAGEIETAKRTNQLHIEDVSRGLVRRCLDSASERRFVQQSLDEQVSTP